jgi:Tol biopolymer transport system component
MRSRKRSGASWPRAALLAATVLLVAGCLHHPDQGTPIPPLPAAGEQVDPGLGPEAQPLSSGPGYKGSPSWSPRGGRIAFTVDGYAVDRPLGTGDTRRWTTRNIVAEDAEWISGDGLAIFGASSGSAPGGEAPRSVYRTRPGEGSTGVKEVATGALAMSPGPGGEGLIVTTETGPYESELALLHDSGAVDRIYTNAIGGRVTGLSLSPDGRRAVLAARTAGNLGSFELHVFDLQDGMHRRLARLEEGMEILGAPQWTKRGICYVVGKEGTSVGGSAEPFYDLYTIAQDSPTPEPTPGVGEDFIASSIRVSPDGERLAVIGRLNPKAPINLYVLDLATQALEAVTTNEDMEIKTGPDDLAWSPGGESVAIVARGALSEEPRVRAAPKGALLEDFYNLYEIPIEGREAAR